MTLAGAFAAAILNKRAAETVPERPDLPVKNPFSLKPALGFGVAYAAIVLVVAGAKGYLGTTGMYVAAACAALADVDAVTIAFSRLGAASVGWQVAAAAVTIAVVTNTLVKIAIAVSMGAGIFGRYVAVALGIVAAIGALTGALVFCVY